jgi:hypothetical protein
MTKKYLSFILIFGLTGLSACGGNKKNNHPEASLPVVGDSIDNQEIEDAKPDSGPREGHFRAILRPLNHSLAGWIPYGKADIHIDSENFSATSWIDDSANVTHMQAIHAGSRCPSILDDENGDQVIDYEEVLRVAEGMLIPLDEDLSSQASGYNSFPKGNFSYNKETSLKNILSDLKSSDEDPNDDLVKLSPSQSLNLSGQVLMVYGINHKINLPPTVRAKQTQTPQYSVPIACGEIFRMND